MSAEQKDIEQNALATKLTGAWTDFKQGKLLSYKLMGVLLLVVVGLALWWYIANERRKVASAKWVKFDEANSVSQLEEIAKEDPKLTVGRVAELAVARSLLGAEGIDQLVAANQEKRQKAIENIEKARDLFGKLLPSFDKDPVFKAECLLGLAKAEAALIGIPAKSEPTAGPGPIALGSEFRGKMEVLIKHLDQLSSVAAPDTPWATESKKMADSLRADPQTFQQTQQRLIPSAPILPKSDDPHGPGGPFPLVPKK